MAETPRNGTTIPGLQGTNPWGSMAGDEHLALADLWLERGSTGLRRAGGFISEELLQELVGPRGVRVYREMRDSSAVVGACLFAIEMLIRNVTWRVDPADDSVLAQDHADFLDGALFHDLDLPWQMLLSEVLSMLPFGWSLFELVLKRRMGPDAPVSQQPGLPFLPSRYDDGRIAFGKIAPRAQDTLLRWEFDDTGGLRGMHQLDSWSGKQAYLPYEKCLLFRPTSWKDNPESRSILRNAYRSYYMVKNLENIEAIGAERDLAGLPVFKVPPQWMSLTATPDDLARLALIKRTGRNIRNDEQACVVLPRIVDANGMDLLTFELLASSGSRQFDVDKIISRYELRIAQSMLADLIFLGHEAVGSFALSSNKTNMLSMALGGYLMAIADVFNRRALPLLWKLNGFPPQTMPTLVHGDVESVDLTELGTFIKNYAQAGFDVLDLDDFFRMQAGFPERDPMADTVVPPAPQDVATSPATLRVVKQRLARQRAMLPRMHRGRQLAFGFTA